MSILDRYKDDQEFALAAHVFANVSHFRKLLTEFPWDSQSDWVQWALLEATLIKARSITDFLITDRHGHRDDFCAKFLIDSWIQGEIEFMEIRELVNKQVAHFSLQRFIAGDPESVVPVSEIRSALTSIDLAFSRFEIEFERQQPELFKDVASQFIIFEE